MKNNELLLQAIVNKFMKGFYPYWDKERQISYWDRTENRSIITLNKRKVKIANDIMRKENFDFEFRSNTNFLKLLAHLKNTKIKPNSWVDDDIAEIYELLYLGGYCHSIEAYSNKQLVGGLIGIQLGRAFIAETMYSVVTGASKACLCHLVKRQYEIGSVFIDVQVEHPKGHPVNKFKEQIVSHSNYARLLEDSMSLDSKVVETRYDRKFPKSKTVWEKAGATVVTIEGGQSLDILGFQVMQSWEAPLMNAMAKTAAARGGIVLEVGYGLGICSEKVQALSPDKHIIIESNHKIAEQARHRFSAEIQSGCVCVIESFWEDLDFAKVLSDFSFDGFDGVIFDTYPLKKEELRRNHFPFFEIANAILKESGVFTYYSDEPVQLAPGHLTLIYQHFKSPEIKTEVIHVQPWESCEYWYWSTMLHVAITKNGTVNLT